jgi:hypothetical protein
MMPGPAKTKAIDLKIDGTLVQVSVPDALLAHFQEQFVRSGVRTEGSRNATRP